MLPPLSLRSALSVVSLRLSPAVAGGSLLKRTSGYVAQCGPFREHFISLAFGKDCVLSAALPGVGAGRRHSAVAVGCGPVLPFLPRCIHQPSHPLSQFDFPFAQARHWLRWMSRHLWLPAGWPGIDPLAPATPPRLRCLSAHCHRLCLTRQQVDGLKLHSCLLESKLRCVAFCLSAVLSDFSANGT